MNWALRNVYIDKWSDIVNEYNNKYQNQTWSNQTEAYIEQ